MIYELLAISLLNAIFLLYNNYNSNAQNKKWKPTLIKIVINFVLMALQLTLLTVLFNTQTENFKNFKEDETTEHFGVFSNSAASWQLVFYVPMMFLFFQTFLSFLHEKGVYLNPYESLKFWGHSYTHKEVSESTMEKLLFSFSQTVIGIIGLFVFLINSPLRLLVSGFIPNTDYNVYLARNEYTSNQLKRVSNKFSNPGIIKLANIKKGLNNEKAKNSAPLKDASVEGYFKKIKETLDMLILNMVGALSPSLDIEKMKEKVEEESKKGGSNDYKTFYESQCNYFKYFLWTLLILPMIFSINSAPAMWFVIILFVIYPFITLDNDNTQKVIRFVIAIVLVSIYLFLVQHISNGVSIALHCVLATAFIGLYKSEMLANLVGGELKLNLWRI